ncbi:hypothetical protein RvY_02489 [Ramazzottius varieornatus]|uniref:Alpha-mannosidase n=1 Tax=Ramazzottius varieornatus TaxID=947166 RepID=A0A1D1URY3_RAMVA|nr:hypothetical protein RvY_02489 [Ramazzottius varieornatus]
MRLSNAFFCAVVFMAVTLLLYFILDLSSTSPNGQRKQAVVSQGTPEEMEALDDLEKKVEKLETSIQRNREIVVSLQGSLKSMLKYEVPLLQEKILRDQNENKMKSIAEKVTEQTNDAVPTKEQESKLVNRMSSPLSQVSSVKRRNDSSACPAETWTQSASDIQMFNVYDKLDFDDPDGGVWKQGFDITYNEDQWTPERPLKVFIVPHSHNDPGWIKTFEKYFEDQTKLIFDLMVLKLPLNPRRKFVWAEISYLSLWWAGADETQKTTFKKLLEDGQLEIVTGGWVMPDEANAHYGNIVDQLVEGQEWIKNHLGENVVPKHGWAVDPFGMSPTVAQVLKWNNFDAMLIQRAHYSIKKHLAKEKSLEFQWRQNWDQDGKTDMLCHLMPFYSYDVPHTCGPDPKICCQFDFKRLPGSGRTTCPWRVPPRPIMPANVKERAETLLDQYKKKAQLYSTNVLMVQLGDDFRYDTPQEWDQQYQNYEKLIKYINGEARLNTRIQFGTLKDYFEELHADVTKNSHKFPTLSGDFFTYADREDHYWSGYFTSRPFYKSMDRILTARLRAAEIAYAMALAKDQKASPASISPAFNDPLAKLVIARRALGLFQHHDGVAGTAKAHVMSDYARKLTKALANCNDVLSSSLLLLLGSPGFTPGGQDTELLPDEFFDVHNKPPRKRRLRVGESGQRLVVFNSLGQAVDRRVTVLVDSSSVSVVEEGTGKRVVAQVNPLWEAGSGQMSLEVYELVFRASIPALGVKTYRVKDVKSGGTGGEIAVLSTVEVFGDSDGTGISDGDVTKPFSLHHKSHAQTFSLESNNVQLLFDGKTGYLQKYVNKPKNIKLGVRLKFQKYGTVEAKDKSGAYLFLPDGPAVDVVASSNGSTTSGEPSSPVIRVIRGAVVSELQVILPNVLHIVRLDHTDTPDGFSPEIENNVDITTTSNFELAMHFKTSIDSGKSFVTDLNGFHLIRRKMHSKLHIQGNLYPMPAAAYIEDAEHRFTLLTKQPLGVASFSSGSLEVILDRRLDQDDNRGMGEPVHDNVALTKSIFRLVVEQSTSSVPERIPVLSLTGQMMAQSILHPPVLLTERSPSNSTKHAFVGLKEDLPCDVHLLNVRTAVAVENDQGGNVSPFGKVNGEGAEKDREGPSALMLLHRTGVESCDMGMKGLKCQPSTGSLNLKEAFAGVFGFPYGEEGPPSPLQKGTLLPVDSSIRLNAMHIRAVRFPLI